MPGKPELTSLASGRFELRALIAQGAVGPLYDAWDHREGVRRAIRLLDAAFTQHPGARSRFLGDPRLAELGDHPNLLRVYDVALEGRQLYQVLEPVDGECLAFILAGNRFAPRAACRVVVGVLDGLTAAHGLGVFHLALGPDAVLLGADDRPRVIEFGMGRVIHEHSAGLIELKPPLRPTWMPPELRTPGQEIGARIDIYAAGALLFTLVTGVVYEDMHEVTEADLAPLMPGPLIPIIRRATAPALADRYASAEEMRGALLEAIELLPSESEPLLALIPAISLQGRPVVQRRRARRFGPLLIAAAAIAIAVGVGLWTGLATVRSSSASAPPRAPEASEPSERSEPSELSAADPASPDGSAAPGALEPSASGSGNTETKVPSAVSPNSAVPAGPPASLLIESATAGTRVRVDGRPLGVLPQTVELPPGTHKVEFLEQDKPHGAIMNVLLKPGESAHACWDVVTSSPC